MTVPAASLNKEREVHLWSEIGKLERILDF